MALLLLLGLAQAGTTALYSAPALAAACLADATNPDSCDSGCGVTGGSGPIQGVCCSRPASGGSEYPLGGAGAAGLVRASTNPLKDGSACANNCCAKCTGGK